ncbi:hypothetical protein ABZ920_18540 [Streptomyces sp. NPDC046831]|uniref:hypothetical protein n=1 Tax=Streptomyces sp. NPDC046831 TaxID=3154805 RepID=UPI0033D82DFF
MQEARCPGSGAPAGEDAERGLGPSVALLVVSLTVAAVGVYQLCGFGLHSLDRRPHLFDDGFATAGVIVAVVAAGAAVGNLAWLLTAPRRRAARTGEGPSAGGPRTGGVGTGAGRHGDRTVPDAERGGDRTDPHAERGGDRTDPHAGHGGDRTGIHNGDPADFGNGDPAGRGVAGSGRVGERPVGDGDDRETHQGGASAPARAD